jgi:hypothetical protein
MHQLEFNGVPYTIWLTPRAKRWDWSYSIAGAPSIRNSGEIAPTQEIALQEARWAAENAIRFPG